MWTLAHPHAFYLLLVPICLVLYFLFKKITLSTKFHSFPLQTSLFKSETKKIKFIFRLLFLSLFILFLVLTYIISAPYQLKAQAKKWTEGMDILITLDLSESMEAADLKPNRFAAAKSVIRDFISHRPEDRIGLVTFSGDVLLRAPLTRDFSFLLNQIDSLALRELKQGTAIGMGLASSISRLRKSQSKNKIIILLTDGDSNVGSINPMTAALLAKQEGIRIYSVGMGEKDRVIIPIYGYDMYGNKTHLLANVPSYINPELLKKVSEVTGGKAYMARDSGGLLKILQEIDSLEKTKLIILPFSKREELFFYPALIASLSLLFIYLLLETRFDVHWRKSDAV